MTPFLKGVLAGVGVTLFLLGAYGLGIWTAL